MSISSLWSMLAALVLFLIAVCPGQCSGSGSSASNSLKGRKVVLMSMDGFRYDYFTKANTPHFDALKATGAYVPYMNNTFATITFPSHYTMATGLYEESHGIVANRMYDPEFEEYFGFTSTASKWWDQAEPIWTNAVKSGLKVGTFFWPGSEADIEHRRPTEWKRYDGKVPYETRVDTVVKEWLHEKDFDFGVIYFDEPDHSGHRYGPEAPEMILVIERMDRILGYFMEKLEETHLKERVDFIVTSDHGMTTVDNKRVIYLSEHVNDTLLLEVVQSGAVVHLRPQPGKAQELVHALSNIDHMNVYLKEDIPDHFHYKHNRRIAAVVAIAEEGWRVAKKKPIYPQKGTHGYSNEYMSMKPIFITSGPSFKRGVEIEPIKNEDIYPLLCHLMNLEPAPHNGSLERVTPLLLPGGPRNFTISHPGNGHPARTPGVGVLTWSVFICSCIIVSLKR